MPERPLQTFESMGFLSRKLRACSLIPYRQRATIQTIRWMSVVSVTFGMSSSGHLLVVAHLQDEGVIRIITARQATRGEKKLYEEG